MADPQEKWRADLGRELLDEARRQQPDVDYIRTSVRRGADMAVTDRDGNSLLILVCTWGNVDLVRETLDAGADVNHAGRSGNTALHLVVASGNNALIRLLLDRGADATLCNGQGKTPGDSARGWQEPDVADRLEKKAAEVRQVREAKEHFRQAVSNGLPVEEAFSPLKPLKFKPAGP